MIPLVTASERGTEQTESVDESRWRCGVTRVHLGLLILTDLERLATESDSLVREEVMVISCIKSRITWIGCLNTAQLSANSKYGLKSDSVLVLRRNVEKNS